MALLLNAEDQAFLPLFDRFPHLVDKIKQAQKEGFKPKEITEFLEKRIQKATPVQQALDEGFTQEEIDTFKASQNDNPFTGALEAIGLTKDDFDISQSMHPLFGKGLKIEPTQPVDVISPLAVLQGLTLEEARATGQLTTQEIAPQTTAASQILMGLVSTLGAGGPIRPRHIKEVLKDLKGFISGIARTKRVPVELDPEDFLNAVRGTGASPKAEEFLKTLSSAERVKASKLAQKGQGPTTFEQRPRFSKSGLSGDVSPPSTSPLRSGTPDTPAQAPSNVNIKFPTKKAFTVQDVKVAQKKSVTPGATLVKSQGVVQEVVNPAQTQVDKAGGAEIRTAKQQALIDKLRQKTGRPGTVDLLPAFSDEQVLKGLATFIAPEKGMLIEDVENTLKVLDPLEIKRLYVKELKKAQAESIKAGLIEKPKVGAPKKSGVSKVSVVKLGQQALEEVRNTRTELSAGLQEEVEAGIKAASLQPAKGKEDLRVGEKGTSGQSGSLVQLNKQLKQRAQEGVESANARGYRATYDPVNKKYQLSGKGPVEEFDTYAQFESHLLGQKLIKQLPVETTPSQGKSVADKIQDGDALTGNDKQTLLKQAKIQREIMQTYEETDPDIPVNVQRVDPLKGRKAGVKKPEKVDVELTEKERFDELLKLGYSEAELRGFETGVITPKMKQKLGQQVLEQFEHDFKDVDDEITFGFGVPVVQIVKRVQQLLRGKRGLPIELRDAKAFRKIAGQQGLPLSTLSALRKSVLELNTIKDLIDGFKITPTLIEEQMVRNGLPQAQADFIMKHVLNPEDTALGSINPLVARSDASDSVKVQTVNALNLAAKLGHTGFKGRVLTKMKDTFKAAGLSIENDLTNKRIDEFLSGERVNLTDAERGVAEEFVRARTDIARQKNIKVTNDTPLYNTKVTHFENLYQNFKRTLQGVKWADIDPEFKGGPIPNARELLQLQRVFRSHSEWRTISNVDRKRLLKAFKFENLSNYDQVPSSLRNGLPKSIFNGFMIPRVKSSVPRVRHAFNNFVKYVDAMSRDMNYTPALKTATQIIDSVRSKGVPLLVDRFTDKGQMEAQVKMMLGQQAYGDKVANWLGQQLNEAIGYDLLTNNKLQVGAKLANTSQALGLLGGRMSAGLSVLNEAVFPWMRNGHFTRSILRLVSDPRKVIQAERIAKGTGDIFERVKLPSNASPAQIASVKAMEKLADIAFLPMNVAVHFTRGMSVLSELNRAAVDGLDPETAINISGMPSSNYVQDVEMTDEMWRVYTGTQKNLNLGQEGRSVVTHSAPARLATFLTAAPFNFAKRIESEFVNAIRYDDKAKLLRWVITIGSLWALPEAFDRAGYDVRNVYGPENVFVRVSAPFFKMIWNSMVAVGGKATGAPIQSIDAAEKAVQKWALNSIPFHRAFEVDAQAQRELSRNAVLNSRADRLMVLSPDRPIDELARLAHRARRNAGIGFTAAKKRSVIIRNERQNKQEQDIAFKDAMIDVYKTPEDFERIHKRLFLEHFLDSDRKISPEKFEAFQQRWVRAIIAKDKSPEKRFIQLVGKSRLTPELILRFVAADPRNEKAQELLQKLLQENAPVQ